MPKYWVKNYFLDGSFPKEKTEKMSEKSPFFLKKIKFTQKKYFLFCIYLLVMPKYWVKNYFTHGRFPEVGGRKTAEKNTFFSLKK